MRDKSDVSEDELNEQMHTTAIGHDSVQKNEREKIKEEFVIAVFDFESNEQGDLTFHQNDTIKVIEKDASGWWKGSLRGNTGVFPSNHFKILPGRQLRANTADLTINIMFACCLERNKNSSLATG